jgi:hypothetical protein
VRPAALGALRVVITYYNTRILPGGSDTSPDERSRFWAVLYSLRPRGRRVRAGCARRADPSPDSVRRLRSGRRESSRPPWLPTRMEANVKPTCRLVPPSPPGAVLRHLERNVSLCGYEPEGELAGKIVVGSRRMAG